MTIDNIRCYADLMSLLMMDHNNDFCKTKSGKSELDTPKKRFRSVTKKTRRQYFSANFVFCTEYCKFARVVSDLNCISPFPLLMS